MNTELENRLSVMRDREREHEAELDKAIEKACAEQERVYDSSDDYPGRAEWRVAVNGAAGFLRGLREAKKIVAM